MAIEYDLKLSTDMKPSQVLEELSARISGLSWASDRRSLFDDVISISAIEMPRRSQELIESAFGFTPTILVGFRLDPDGDRTRFRDVLLMSTLLLLEHSQDAVMLFNGERVTLQRLAGVLAFSTDSGLWHDTEWLKRMVMKPFELRPLPSPLL